MVGISRLCLGRGLSLRSASIRLNSSLNCLRMMIVKLKTVMLLHSRLCTTINKVRTRLESKMAPSSPTWLKEVAAKMTQRVMLFKCASSCTCSQQHHRTTSSTRLPKHLRLTKAVDHCWRRQVVCHHPSWEKTTRLWISLQSKHRQKISTGRCTRLSGVIFRRNRPIWHRISYSFQSCSNNCMSRIWNRIASTHSGPKKHETLGSKVYLRRKR